MPNEPIEPFDLQDSIDAIRTIADELDSSSGEAIRLTVDRIAENCVGRVCWAPATPEALAAIPVGTDVMIWYKDGVMPWRGTWKFPYDADKDQRITHYAFVGAPGVGVRG